MGKFSLLSQSLLQVPLRRSRPIPRGEIGCRRDLPRSRSALPALPRRIHLPLQQPLQAGRRGYRARGDCAAWGRWQAFDLAADWRSLGRRGRSPALSWLGGAIAGSLRWPLPGPLSGLRRRRHHPPGYLGRPPLGFLSGRFLFHTGSLAHRARGRNPGTPGLPFAILRPPPPPRSELICPNSTPKWRRRNG